MTLASIAHQPNPGAIVFLFRIDVTSVGGGINYFTQGKVGVDDVTFGGQPYTAVDIHLSEFDTTAGGVLPTPKIQISNSNSVIQAMVNTYGDLCGCEIRRVRTFGRFLDGQSEADPAAFMGPDVFRIERKTSENPIFIEWELSAAIDQEGKMLPGRQVLRDACTQRYRVYGPGQPGASFDGFIYPTINPCPYTGSNYFTLSGLPTTIDKDVCGRKLSDCQLRFGVANPLPFGGFPGVGRIPG